MERLKQDSWLDRLVNSEVVIYLGSGIKLEGTLLDHDADVLFIGAESRDPVGGYQMVYKAFAATVQPAKMQRRRVSDTNGRARTSRPVY